MMMMGKEDRISSLPDELIHHIFAFLDMKQVVQASILSTRWRTLWVSNPSLNLEFFDSWALDNSESDERHDLRWIQFVNFVNRVLLLPCNLHRFHFDNPLEYGQDHVQTWITTVMRRNVQEVGLSCVAMGDSMLRPLAGVLKSLRLEYVCFKEVDGGEGFLLSSPIMEKLILKNCLYDHHERFTIDAPNLKYLMVYGGNAYDDDKGTHSCCIKICAQNLKRLKFEGCIFKDYSLENLSALATVGISSYSYPVHQRLARCLKNLLKGLTNAESLTLSACTFQVFPRVPNTFNTMDEFQSLRYLKLTEWRTTGYICVIAKLLQKFPRLETLVVERTERRLNRDNKLEPETKGRDWEAQLLSSCMLCPLKYIEIQNPEGSDNEFKFLQFLMKYATNLENIVMTATSTHLTEKNKLVKFREMLLKGSPIVRVLHKERNIIAL